MEEEVGKNYLDYRGSSPEEWIDLLRILESRDDRRGIARESQKPSAKRKKKSEKPDEADANRESSPRVPCKKLKHNTGKSKQQKTASHRGTQKYCILIKKVGYSKRKYRYPFSDQCIAFDSAKINKYLDGCLAKQDSAFKQFLNTENKTQKNMKAPKKQNNMLFNMARKSIYHHELN